MYGHHIYTNSTIAYQRTKKMENNFDFVINFRIYCRAPGNTGDALSHAGCWHLYGVSSVSVSPKKTSGLNNSGPFRQLASCSHNLSGHPVLNSLSLYLNLIFSKFLSTILFQSFWWRSNPWQPFWRPSWISPHPSAEWTMSRLHNVSYI